MRLINGAPVDTTAAGCCVGLRGVGSAYATCMSEPSTSGIVLLPDTTDYAWVFTCDRHAVILESPRALTIDDVDEINRRRREQ
jgi:hypothetical protein